MKLISGVAQQGLQVTDETVNISENLKKLNDFLESKVFKITFFLLFYE